MKFTLALFFVIDLQAGNGLTVDAGANTLLSAKVSLEPAHANSAHDARVNQLLEVNPQATKALCDACVAAEEDLVSNQTILEDALRNFSTTTKELSDATTAYAACLLEQVDRKSTLDTAETLLRTGLDTAKTDLTALTLIVDSTLAEVNAPDPAGAVGHTDPVQTCHYDGDGIKNKAVAWQTAFNAHATKVAECNILSDAVANATAAANGDNATVITWTTAVDTANATAITQCDAMRAGVPTSANSCQEHYAAGVRTPSHSRTVTEMSASDVPTTTYKVIDGSTEVDTQCAFWFDRGWTLALKITDDTSSGDNPGKSLKGTGAINVGALVTAPTDGQAGKLSDEWIKANCDGQYMMQQYDNTGTPMRYFPEYCKFNDVTSYADQTRTAKKCSGNTETYIEDGSYTTTDNPVNHGWTNGFSSWRSTGDIIVQLNHQDGRLGSHIQQGGSSSGGCTSSGGCHVMIWCAK